MNTGPEKSSPNNNKRVYLVSSSPADSPSSLCSNLPSLPLIKTHPHTLYGASTMKVTSSWITSPSGKTDRRCCKCHPCWVSTLVHLFTGSRHDDDTAEDEWMKRRWQRVGDHMGVDTREKPEADETTLRTCWCVGVMLQNFTVFFQIYI